MPEAAAPHHLSMMEVFRLISAKKATKILASNGLQLALLMAFALQGQEHPLWQAGQQDQLEEKSLPFQELPATHF